MIYNILKIYEPILRIEYENRKRKIAHSFYLR